MTRKKNLFSLSALVVFAIFPFLGLRPIFAQTESLKKAVEGVQESVTTLVNARDDKISNDFALRAETFKRILDLSISEARDLKAKILLDDGNKSDEFEAWKKSAVKRIDDVLAFLKNEQDALAEISDVEAVKVMAADFKLWREGMFVPLSDEVNYYSTIQKAEKIMIVTRAREVRIREDLKKIGKKDPKNGANLELLLEKAGKFVDNGEGNFKDARSIFYKIYVIPVLLVKTTSAEIIVKNDILKKSLSSGSSEAVSSSVSQSLFFATTTASSLTSSSISESSTETVRWTDLENFKKQAITNLARSSFQNIREAYQIFIEMSNLVRKLF